MIRTYLQDIASGELHLLQSGLNLVGRGPRVEVEVQGSGVSRIHCALYVDPAGSVLLNDLESKNGTQLDGRTLEETEEVRVGQILEVGRVRLRVGQIDAERDPQEQRALVLPAGLFRALLYEHRQSA